MRRWKLGKNGALAGVEVLSTVNFASTKIDSIKSEFFLVGFYRGDGSVILAVPDQSVPNGAKPA